MHNYKKCCSEADGFLTSIQSLDIYVASQTVWFVVGGVPREGPEGDVTTGPDRREECPRFRNSRVYDRMSI